MSAGVRGPASSHAATSVDPIDITSMQITKSINSKPEKEKGSDTLGMKHRVDLGAYIFYGSNHMQ
ncbi:type I CRISPR-associated protein Cas7 [Bacillus thuringiensis]|nr:type I CRISPR-associated protein Cas7 [Bacillus thuringiensis]